MDQNDENHIEQRLRMEALLRQTHYSHPPLQIHHKPITSKQCSELQEKLKGNIQVKVQQIRRNEQQLLLAPDKYDQLYEKHFNMNIKNEIEDQKINNAICEMHNVADILMNPPSFGDDLYLYRKEKPTYGEQLELNTIFSKYQNAYEAKQNVDDGLAEETIRRAKIFLLRNQDEQ